MRTFKSLKFSLVPAKDIHIVKLNRELDNTEHNYNIKIYPAKKGGYTLAIYLDMTRDNAKDILVCRRNYESIVQAEKNSCKIINELEKSNLDEYIEEWKSCNIRPVFDKSCKFLGDIYTSIPILQKNAKSYDYYNSTPIKTYYGDFYVLDRQNNKNCYKKEVVVFNTYISKTENDSSLLKKMLSQLNKRKYSRFFE